MAEIPFVGGSYAARSPNFDAQRTINLYPEIGSGTSKAPGMLIGTPGLKLWLTLPTLGIRGMLYVNATTCLVAAGNTIYKVLNNATYSVIGTIDAQTTPVSMSSNGFIAMIVTGPNGYIVNYSSWTIAQITDPDFAGSDKVDFLDGYFIFNKTGTQQFQITNLYGQDIDGLDFASAEGAPDLLLTLIVDHREAWMMGETTSEVFVNTGNPDFPIERIQGAFIEQGCAAKNSVVKLANTIIWLARDTNGQGTIQQAQGYAPQRISNHGIEFAIASYSRIDDAVAYSYKQEGHEFYVISFPTAQKTWAYDLSMPGFWCERAWRNPDGGALERHRSNCHLFFANKNIVGDWENGNLYELDLNTYTDNGNLLPAIRQFPHVAQGNAMLFFHELWVDMETGIGLLSGVDTDPELLLEWSDDGGHVFGNGRTAKVGKMGEYRVRANFRRLSKGRDRIFRITFTHACKRVLIGADVRTSTGAS